MKLDLLTVVKSSNVLPALAERVNDFAAPASDAGRRWTLGGLTSPGAAQGLRRTCS